jgi:GNAT superfamily N-acetyltransferase
MEQSGIPKDLHDLLWEKFNNAAGTDKLNFETGKAYGVTWKRDVNGNITKEIMTDHPLATTQLANSWFAPDPVVMRRFSRDLTGDLVAASQWLRRVADHPMFSPHLPEELAASVERGMFHDRLETELVNAGWDASSRKWAHDMWDIVGSTAVGSRGDLYPTVDSFFQGLHVQFGGDSGDIAKGLFKTIVEADPEISGMIRRVHSALNSGQDSSYLWYNTSKQALETLGSRYLFGTTTLQDGREVSDLDLFTQILAAKSPVRPVVDDLLSSIQEFGRMKADAAQGLPAVIADTLPNRKQMIDDIMAGSRPISDLPPRAQERLLKLPGNTPDTMVNTGIDNWEYLYSGDQITPSSRQRLKVWNFYKNLKGDMQSVTVDTWMFHMFGIAGGSPTEYQKVETWIRQIAADTGLEPAQAQAMLWSQYKNEIADKFDRWKLQLRGLADRIDAGQETTDSAQAYIDQAILSDRDAPFHFNEITKKGRVIDRVPKGDNPAQLREIADYFARNSSKMRDARDFRDLTTFAPSLGEAAPVVSQSIEPMLDLPLSFNDSSPGRFVLDEARAEDITHVGNGVYRVKVDGPPGEGEIWYVHKNEIGQVDGFRMMGNDGKPTKVGMSPNAGDYSLITVDPTARGKGVGPLLFDTSIKDMGYSQEEILQHLHSMEYSSAGAKNTLRAIEQMHANAATESLATLEGIRDVNRRQILGHLRDTLNKTKADGTVLGATSFGPNNERLVQIFKGADPQTMLHEMGHVVRQIMPVDDIRAIEKELGVQFGSLEDLFGHTDVNGAGVFNPQLSAAARDAEEKFATMLEHFFETGQASSSTKHILERLRSFFVRLYERVRGEKGAFSPESKAVLERWFGDRPIPTVATNDTRARILTEDHLNIPDANGVMHQRVVTRYLRNLASSGAETYIHFWKPWQVLRPAYVLRVPGFDEQIRFLADQGLSSRLNASKNVERAGHWLESKGAAPAGWDATQEVIPVKIGPDIIVDVKRPSAQATEAYANSEVSGESAYATFAEQMKAAVNDHQFTRTWKPLDETASTADYRAAADTALNGHVGESPQGFLALRDIVNGVPEEESVANLTKWFETDPNGKIVAARLGIPADELELRARDYVSMVRHYTFSDPEIASAAMHHQFDAGMLDAHLQQLANRGELWLKSNALDVPRTLDALDAPDSTLAEQVRQVTKSSDGATVDPGTGKFKTPGQAKGFAVGIQDKTAHAAEASVLEDPVAFKKAWDAFLEKPNVRQDMAKYKEAHIGTWVDGGKVHFDVSVVVPEFGDAMGIARFTRQEGIANLSKAVDDASFYTETVKKPTIEGLKTDTTSSAPQNPYRKIVNGASKWILQEPTNRMSRQPFFHAWYDEMLKAQIDWAKSTDMLPADTEAAQQMVKTFEQNARRFAIERTQRVMFNIRDTNRLSEMAWFVAPFSQPFFEAFTVYNNLIRSNPSLIGWANFVLREAIDNKVVYKNDQGQYVIPMTNWLGYGTLMRVLSHQPLNLSVPLGALNLFYNNALPLNLPLVGDVSVPFPGFSPPIQWVVQKFIPADSTSRLATWAHQYGDVGLKQILPFPSWLQNAIQAVNPGAWNADAYKAYIDSFMQMNQSAGMTFPNAQAARDYAAGQARTFYIWKTGMSLLFPGAVSVDFPQKSLQDEYQHLIDKLGDPLAARDEFLRRHPNDWLIVQAKTVWEQQDPHLPTGFPGVPIPANQAADTILNMPGFKEFAAANPWWAWAVLPKSVLGAEYNPDVFHKQLSSVQRTYLDPIDFYKHGEAAAGWNAYWHLSEWWSAKKEYLAGRNVSTTDPEYIDAKAQYDGALQHIQISFPGFADSFNAGSFGGPDQRQILYAQALAKNKFFLHFPTGQSLKGYMDLRAETLQNMKDLHVTALGTVAATDSGIQATYDAGVQKLIADNPQFATVYKVFFGNDLTAGVGVVDVMAAVPEAARQPIYDWQSNYNTLRDQIRLAPDAASRATLYGQENALVNQAYSDFTPDQNPLVLWWNSQDYNTRQETTLRTYLKPYVYLNQFERTTILGEMTGTNAEAQWAQYADYRTQIQQRANDPSFDTSAAYKAVDNWLVGQASNDPVLQAQIDHANTWGYEFWTHNPYTSLPGQAADSWNALHTLSLQMQDAVRTRGIHSGADMLKLHNYMLDQVRGYMADTTFANQWNYLEKLSSGDLIDVLVPQFDYPIVRS